MPLWKFMVLDFVAKTLWSFIYLGLGWWIGEPVVFVLDQYAKVANWVAIALIVVVMVGAFRAQAKKQQAEAAPAVTVGNELEAGH